MGVGTFKDKNGRTRYRVTLSRNGRRLVDERLPAGTSREKAEAYHARIVGQWFDRNRLGVSEVPLISAVIREYERRIIPGLKSPRYPKHCIAAIAKHVIGRTLDQAPEAADAVAAALKAQSPATVAHRVSFLKTLCRYAVKWRMVKIDYGMAIVRPEFNNHRHHYIDKAILAQILRHASKPVRRACWQLFYSGMRRGELYAANVYRGCYAVSDTKNGEPRMIPVPKPVERFAGRPTIHRDSITKAFKVAAKRAGYGHLRLHDLRHSFASQLLNVGADLGTVGKILGHKAPQSTARYAHLAIETHREWMNFAARGRQVTDGLGQSDWNSTKRRPKKAA